jgi:electron transport complex protein RnfC
LPFADEIIVPLAQSIGRPAKAIVFRGQHVVRIRNLLARVQGSGNDNRRLLTAFRSRSNINSLDGTCNRSMDRRGHKAICFSNDFAAKQPAIIITTSLNSGQQIPDSGERYDYLQMSREELVKAVQNTGLVGLGGAAFPTHVKMAIPPDRTIHTVLVNGCECEPFLTTDHRVMLEKIDNLLLGIRIAMRTVAATKAIIGIEDNKLNVLAAIKPYLPDDGTITIEAVETKYPQGAEKMLAYSLLGIEIPSGGLPSEVGLAIFNVATLAELGALLPVKQGLVERIITITGDGVKKPGNYLAPIGTPVRFLLEYAEFIGAEAELILGGPMMGMPARSLDVPITKGTGALLVLDKRASKGDDILPCIKCTQCLQACPINLNPSELGLLAAKRQYDVMEEQYHLNDCFECGCCSYVCPSNIEV